MDMDVESLQKTGRRRGSCLDVFLVVSVIFLFAAVAAVAAGGVTVMMELRSRLNKTPNHEPHASGLEGLTSGPVYKMQNFAYLGANKSELNNSTMYWAEVHYGPGGSVGSNFEFNQVQQWLKPKQMGTYFMYLELTFTCTHICKKGLFSMHVEDQLTCNVQLPNVTGLKSVTHKCWAVRQMGERELVTQMSVPKDGLGDWKLDLNDSKFGMFLLG